MKDFLPPLFLVLCGMFGLFLIFNRESGSELNAATPRKMDRSIIIRSVNEDDNYSDEKVHILEMEDISISRDSNSYSKL